MEALPSYPGTFAAAPGIACWRSRTLDRRVAGAVRILPDDLWDAFFLCRIGKEAG